MNKSAVQAAKPLYSLLTLQISLVPWKYLLEITERALRHKKRASSPAAAKLNDMLGHMKVHGFRNASKAPIHLLVERMASWCDWDQSGWCLRQILCLWVDSLAPLRDAARELVKRLGDPATFDVSTARAFVELWEPEQLEDWTRQLEQLHPGVQKRDLQLMLSCVTGRVLIPPEHRKDLKLEEDSMPSAPPPTIAPAPAPEEETSESPWHQFIEAARSLPADAPEWGELDAVITKLRAVAASKAQEREEQQSQQKARQTLQFALEALRTACASELEYFGFTDTQSWRVDAFAPKDHAVAAQRLERLKEVLLHNQELTSLPRAKNREEDRARQEKIYQAQEEATALHGEISSLISSPTKPPDGSGPGSPPGPATKPEVVPLQKNDEGSAPPPPAAASANPPARQEAVPQQRTTPASPPQTPEQPPPPSELTTPPVPSPKQAPAEAKPPLAVVRLVDPSPASEAVPLSAAPPVRAEEPPQVASNPEPLSLEDSGVDKAEATVQRVEAFVAPVVPAADTHDVSSQAAAEPQTTSADVLVSQTVPGRKLQLDYLNAGLERLAYLDTPGAFILLEASNHSSTLPWLVFLTEQAFTAPLPATERPSTPEIDKACASASEASHEWTELDKRLAGLVCTSLVVLDGLPSPSVHALFQFVRDKTPTPPSYLYPFFRFWDVAHKPVVSLRKLLEDERSLKAQLARASGAVLEALKLCRHMQFNFTMGNRFIAKVFPPNGGRYAWIETAVRAPITEVLGLYAEQLEEMKNLSPDEIIDSTCSALGKKTIDWSARIAIRQRMLDLRERVGEWESLVRALLEPPTRSEGTTFFRDHLLELWRSTNQNLSEPRNAQERALNAIARELLDRCHRLLGVQP